jgi:DNA polymerase-3 subunit delta
VAATFKPAYLIHGDDHGRIAERRAKLRALAERDGGAQGVELFEGEGGSPDAVAAALEAMTLAIGRRFIVVDGVERWKDRELDELVRAMATMPPDTTVAFFAREEGRFKVPGRLREAVSKAGGDIAAERSVKPWELPKWVVARGRELGLELAPDAARALVAHVGDRQQRLLRELEKLALELIPPGSGGEAGGRPRRPRDSVAVDTDAVLALAAPSAQRRAWSRGGARGVGCRHGRPIS